MKTISKLIFTAILALAAASCALEVDDTEGRKPTAHFEAVMEDPTTTKVYVGEMLKPVWNAADLVSIFDNNKFNSKYGFAGAEGAKRGGFTPVSTGSGDVLDNYVYAVYPYNNQTQIKWHTKNQEYYWYISTKLPDEQTYKSNSFGVGANTMMAVSAWTGSDNVALSFKNVCGYMKLQLYGENVSVSQIKIEGKNGEKIAGDAYIRMQSGLPTVNFPNTATSTITLVCNPSVKLGATPAASKDFWFVIPPVTFSEGFTITVTDESGNDFTKSTPENQAITVTRNTLEWMSKLEVEMPDPTRPSTLSGKVYLAGDSHVADATSLRTDPYDPIPRWGWGEKLGYALDTLTGRTLTPEVHNWAGGGRSSEDFKTKQGKYNRWEEIMTRLSVNDLVLIEFGPNDLKQHVSLQQYDDNLKWYIDETLSKGAWPVLVTPPNTCTFQADKWTVIASEWSAYSAKMREVAGYRDTPLIDIETMSQAWLAATGYTAALPYYLRSFDPSDLGHLKDLGAGLYAGMIAQGLRDLEYWY